jgi:hypothetical protein
MKTIPTLLLAGATCFVAGCTTETKSETPSNQAAPAADLQMVSINLPEMT